MTQTLHGPATLTGTADNGWTYASRFMKKYEKAPGPFRALIQQELRFLEETMRSGNRLRYDSVEGLGDKSVRELEIGGGSRLLVHIKGKEVTLLDVGDHAIVTEFKRGKTLRADLKSRLPLPARFLSSSLLSFFPALDSHRPAVLPRYANEVLPEWLYFLDDDQYEVFLATKRGIEDALVAHKSYLRFLLGGPGTGKTSVLLQLLVALGADVLPNEETWRVGLSVSDALADLIEGTTGWDLSVVRNRAAAFIHNGEPLDVLLLDDPRSIDEVSVAMRVAETLRHPVCVVAALDPLQQRASVTDQAFLEVVERHDGATSVLKNCYRMKREIGSLALAVVQAVDQSSPYLDSGKRTRFAAERMVLSKFVNDMKLPNPSGYVRTQRDGDTKDWERHLDWVVRQHTPTRAWEQLALIVAEDVTIPDDWRQAIADRRISFTEVPLAAVERVKGLEFAHVAIFLTEDRFRDAEEGFTGSGRRRYDDYRLLRIPFSRARDSLLVWVVPQAD